MVNIEKTSRKERGYIMSNDCPLSCQKNCEGCIGQYVKPDSESLTVEKQRGHYYDFYINGYHIVFK